MGDAIVIAAAAVILATPFVILLRRRGRAVAARVAAKDWPAVAGRITISSLQQVPRSGSLITGSYKAVVWYEYFVDGSRYSNNVVDLGDVILRKNMPTLILFTRVQPDDAVKRYPEGADVTVYVDPGDPKHSCLER